MGQAQRSSVYEIHERFVANLRIYSTSQGSASEIMNESFYRTQNVSLNYTELQTLAETLRSHLGYRTVYLY
jgi:hypothetical protein